MSKVATANSIHRSNPTREVQASETPSLERPGCARPHEETTEDALGPPGAGETSGHSKKQGNACFVRALPLGTTCATPARGAIFTR